MKSSLYYDFDYAKQASTPPDRKGLFQRKSAPGHCDDERWIDIPVSISPISIYRYRLNINVKKLPLKFDIFVRVEMTHILKRQKITLLR